MRLQTLRGAPAGRPAVACPIDTSAVHWDEAGITCLACGRSWRRRGNVALFVDDSTDFAEENDSDSPVERNDWRFHLPIDETTRVLELGREDDGAAIALSYEAAHVVAIRESAPAAIRLEMRGRELALPTLAPVAAPLGVLPIPDRSIDVAVIHDALVRVAARADDATIAQRRLLRALFRKVVPGGLLWAEMPNRFAPQRLTRSLRGEAGLHGLDGMRRLLAENGFAAFDTFVVLRTRGQRHLVPLEDPTVFEFVRGASAPGTRIGAARDFAARHAFRAGLVPRLASAFVFRATRGQAR